MRLRARPDLWASSLFLALGLLPLTGCAGSTGDGESTNTFTCEGAQPNEATGYTLCENGVTIRETVVACPTSVPRAEPQSTSAMSECTYDSDCVAMPNGYCSINTAIGGDAAGAYCYYGCLTDADCSAGQICMCGDPLGSCVQANCASDADCRPGFHCASYDASGGCGFNSFACQKPADECVTSADCGGAGLVCNLNATTQARECTSGGCAIGRPFLVDDVARVAPTARRTDWLARGFAPELDSLAPELRLRLAKEWTRAAQLEHASVAAFARFLLELMAFGAPAELVADTVSAIEDERQHAQICFTLASEYAAELIGPGALDVEGALATPTLARSLATAVREGCIGETIAALEAAELAAHVTDPLLQQVLERIAADERRHSELAWKFAQWAVSQDAALADVLESELRLVQEEIDDYDPLTSGPRTHELARAGVMPEPLRAAVRDAGLRQIVEPGLAGIIAHARRDRVRAA